MLNRFHKEIATEFLKLYEINLVTKNSFFLNNSVANGFYRCSIYPTMRTS